MFRKHFGIEKNPFSNTPDPEFFFRSRCHEEALAHLAYGIAGGSGFAMLTGEVGTGKTTLCRTIISQMYDEVDLALCLNPRLSEVEFLATICEELHIRNLKNDFGVKEYTDALNLHLLNLHAAGRKAVIIIDEAQNLRMEVLEQVRLLTNLETSTAKLLQIILVGQPELKDMLSKTEMRQVNQRITARYHLEPLDEHETVEYIEHRLKIVGLAIQTFDGRALDIIREYSTGVPRLINAICERCLLGAFAKGFIVVDADLARIATREVTGQKVNSRSISNATFLMMAFVACVSVIVAISFTQQAMVSHLISSLSSLVKGPVNRPSEIKRNGYIDDVSRATDTMFDIWKLEKISSTQNPCLDVEKVGLGCLRGRGEWNQLLKLNRPAVISMVKPDKSVQYAVISKIEGPKVSLRDGSLTTITSASQLQKSWSGEYLMFWRPPPVFSREMEPGMSGEDIVWLRLRLAEITGEDADTKRLYDYDDALAKRVVEFKRSHNLPENERVDVMTMIILNSSVSGSNSPMILSRGGG